MSAPLRADATDAAAKPGAAAPAVPLLLDTTMFWSRTGGGVRRYLLTKRAWLQSRPQCGWRHAIAAPGLDASLGLDLGGLPLPGSGGYRVVLGRTAAARALVALRPALIEAGDPYRLAWSALDAAQSLGVPAVACCHSDLGALAERAGGASARRAALRYLRHVYREFDLVLAPGRAVVGMLRELGLERAHQQPMGVDVEVFRPQAPEPLLRARLGLPAGTRLLLYAGRLAPEKNLPLLVDTLQRLGPRYALLMIGAGPARPPAHPRLRVMPFEPAPAALARLIASADVFVHAGDQETFGMAALEAMACGTPVVVRDRAGLAEVVEQGGGVAVAQADPRAWAEAVSYVCAMPREVWSDAARARAMQFRWDRLLPELLRRYDRLRGAPRASTGPAPGRLWRPSF